VGIAERPITGSFTEVPSDEQKFFCVEFLSLAVIKGNYAVMYSARYFCPILTKFENFSTDFHKSPQHKISRVSVYLGHSDTY
jgi:hypothetical protein